MREWKGRGMEVKEAHKKEFGQKRTGESAESDLGRKEQQRHQQETPENRKIRERAEEDRMRELPSQEKMSAAHKLEVKEAPKTYTPPQFDEDEVFTDRVGSQSGRPKGERAQRQGKSSEEYFREEKSKSEQETGKASGREMFEIVETEQWTELVKSPKPIVVDFYKVETGDSRRLYPNLMNKFNQSSESWVLVGANADTTKELISEFRVEEYPTLLLFHKGKLVDKCKKGEGLDKFMDKVMDLSNKS
jgi:thioredoxin 1